VLRNRDGRSGDRAGTRRPTALALAAALAAAALIAGCGSSANATGASSPSGAVNVVATENFWGSIASQLAGSKATVHSIIVNPAQDPHVYEPSAADARTMATSQLAIVNGVGYDPWAPKLLAANPVSGRAVLTVGDLFGLKEGDNPHRWYSPTDVTAVATAITADLKKLDPKDATYFTNQLATFENSDLAQYHALISQIKSRYAGVPVGASESIFALLSPSLGLDLRTPYSFMKAISEGTSVSAQDTLTTERQITGHQIKVWIYNSQNATPGIQRLNTLARAAHIPISTVTETLDPANVSFEQWQVSQLERISQALHQATGR
jgi:zinc/manganese transport system substrate-binding protein